MTPLLQIAHKDLPAAISCDSVTSPRWTLEGRLLNRIKPFKPKVLNIQRVDKSNIGNYVCTGTDEVGNEFYAVSKINVIS